MSRRLTILACLLLAGCARFHNQPLSPAQNAANLENRRLESEELHRFIATNTSVSLPAWPPPTWDFRLLTLAAIYYHPSLDVARAQWDVAEGGAKTAAQRPNPVLSAIPGYSITPNTGPSPWLPAVSLDIPIETMGKRGYRIAQSRHLTEAARLNLATVAWSVRSNLRLALIDLAAARQRESLLREQLALQDRIVHSLEQRLEAGAVAISDLSLVRIARQRVQIDFLDSERRSEEARARVADAIGIPVHALASVKLPEDFPPSIEAGELLSPELRRQALLGRADIRAALEEYAATQSALQLEIAKQYPDIHLGPGYQYDQANSKFTLAITAELPILSQNQGPIAEAEARRKQAAAKFNALQAKVMTDIDTAILTYRATEKQLSQLNTLTEAQRKQSQTISSQVKAGASDPLDEMNSELEVDVDELAGLDGRLRLQQALGALEDALQRPLETMKPSLYETSQRAQAMQETAGAQSSRSARSSKAPREPKP